MADERARRIERAARAGDEEAGVRLLRERVRAGELDRRVVGTLALLGYPPAWAAQSVDEGRATLHLDDETRLLTALARCGRRAWLRAAVALARLCHSRASTTAAKLVERHMAERHLPWPARSVATRAMNLPMPRWYGDVARNVTRMALLQVPALGGGSEGGAWDLLQGIHRAMTHSILPRHDPRADRTMLEAVRDDLALFLLGTGDPVVERGRLALRLRTSTDDPELDGFLASS